MAYPTEKCTWCGEFYRIDSEQYYWHLKIHEVKGDWYENFKKEVLEYEERHYKEDCLDPPACDVVLMAEALLKLFERSNTNQKEN